MRDAAAAKVADMVSVTLKPDTGSRELAMPEALLRALDQNDKAKAAWELLSPSQRREILTYLNFLKTPDALQRNVKKTIEKLERR